jgi:hypothetical protein
MTAQEILYAKRSSLCGLGTHPSTYEELGKSWAWAVLYNAKEHLSGQIPRVRTDFGHIFGWMEEFEAKRERHDYHR